MHEYVCVWQDLSWLMKQYHRWLSVMSVMHALPPASNRGEEHADYHTFIHITHTHARARAHTHTHTQAYLGCFQARGC